MNESLLLSRILSHYELRVVSHEHLRTSENRVVRVETDDGQSYALRIRRILGAYRERIESELRVLDAFSAVAREAIPVPLATRDGRLYCIVPHEGADYMGVLFRWVPGEPAGGAGLTSFHLAAMARAVADFHAFSRTYDPPAGFDRPVYDEECFFGATSWRADPAFVERLPRDHVEFLSAADAAIRVRLRKYPCNRDTFGLIHYDLHAGNFLFQEGVANMIDFDECGFGWYLFDLAHILFEFVGDPRLGAFKDVVEETYAGTGLARRCRDGELNLFLALQGIAYLNWLCRIFRRDGNTSAMDDWVPVLRCRIEAVAGS